jgi:16S rRNA C967 or C1407 C5-methylase (RsmB/RsmF family)
VRPLADADGFVRTLPHRHDADGFVMARLERVR